MKAEYYNDKRNRSSSHPRLAARRNRDARSRSAEPNDRGKRNGSRTNRNARSNSGSDQLRNSKCLREDRRRTARSPSRTGSKRNEKGPMYRNRSRSCRNQRDESHKVARSRSSSFRKTQKDQRQAIRSRSNIRTKRDEQQQMARSRSGTFEHRRDERRQDFRSCSRSCRHQAKKCQGSRSRNRSSRVQRRKQHQTARSSSRRCGEGKTVGSQSRSEERRRRCENDNDEQWQVWQNDRGRAKSEHSRSTRSISIARTLIHRNGVASPAPGDESIKQKKRSSKSIESGKTRSVSSGRMGVEKEQSRAQKPQSPCAKSPGNSLHEKLTPEVDDPYLDPTEENGVCAAPESDEAKAVEGTKGKVEASQAENPLAQSPSADFDSVVDRVRHERRLRQRGVQTFGDGFSTTSIIVSGCANAAISSALKGTYSFSSMNHGRPVFQKDYPPKDLDVMIYYWDERDGDRFCGWWISPALGCDYIWAHHPSRSALAPPGTGWNVPHDEAVDPSFNVVSREVRTSSLRHEDLEQRSIDFANRNGE